MGKWLRVVKMLYLSTVPKWKTVVWFAITLIGYLKLIPSVWKLRVWIGWV